MLPEFWGPVGFLFLGWVPNLNSAPCSLALSLGFCNPSPSCPPSPGQNLRDGRPGQVGELPFSGNGLYYQGLALPTDGSASSFSYDCLSHMSCV